MTRETYRHTFPGGTTADATVDVTGFHIEWSEFPPPVGLIPEYLRWREMFLADFTRKTGLKILVVDLVP
jgi:hypothetical protein